jgi:hypothetical protein
MRKSVQHILRTQFNYVILSNDLHAQDKVRSLNWRTTVMKCLCPLKDLYRKVSEFQTRSDANCRQVGKDMGAAAVSKNSTQNTKIQNCESR